ncbi:MAG: helix-turn-helix transcriptional regulator [Chitinispirillaceae bacterium]|nr:helix-turn-helix transcriptional regulator [Chitinispirillaceae bacterium]
MPAAVRTHRIKRTTSRFFHFKKSTPKKVLDEIAARYSEYLTDARDQYDEAVDIKTTGWFNVMEKEMGPDDYLKHLREAHGLTQKELGEKAGTNAAHISDYETGQRTISKEMAKKLAEIFNVNPGTFI